LLHRLSSRFFLTEVQHYRFGFVPIIRRWIQVHVRLTRESTPPASVRLVDNLQFQFGLALKPKSNSIGKLKSKVERFVVTKVKGFSGEEWLLAPSSSKERAMKSLSSRRTSQESRRATAHEGGAENGRRGYQLTYSIGVHPVISV
jgi:alkyldihydroxyacetonephosphate synthase